MGGGRAMRRRRLARESGAVAIADALLPGMLTPPTLSGSPEMAASVRKLMAATPVPGMVGALAAMRDRVDSTALLPTLDGLPTLVVVGGEDKLISPDEGHAMAGAIPGARLVVVPGAGHLVSVEKATEVTGLLRHFLKGL